MRVRPDADGRAATQPLRQGPPLPPPVFGAAVASAAVPALPRMPPGPPPGLPPPALCGVQTTGPGLYGVPARTQRAPRNTSSRFRGVSRAGAQWQARIKAKGQPECKLGQWASEEQAAWEYDKAAIAIHGNKWGSLNYQVCDNLLLLLHVVELLVAVLLALPVLRLLLPMLLLLPLRVLILLPRRQYADGDQGANWIPRQFNPKLSSSLIAPIGAAGMGMGTMLAPGAGLPPGDSPPGAAPLPAYMTVPIGEAYRPGTSRAQKRASRGTSKYMRNPCCEFLK